MPHERKPSSIASNKPLGRPKSSGSRQQVIADQTTHTGSTDTDKAHASQPPVRKPTRRP